MKKLIIAIFGIVLVSFSANAIERKAGINVSLASLDTKVTDDVDSNGTINTTKDISNDVVLPSFFFELGGSLPNGGKISAGIDFLPLSAELEADQLHKQLTTQTLLQLLEQTVVQLMSAIMLLRM